MINNHQKTQQQKKIILKCIAAMQIVRKLFPLYLWTMRKEVIPLNKFLSV